MRIEVQFFSRLRDVAGASSVSVELPSESTLGDLLAKLHESYPGLGPWSAHLLLAVGLDFAEPGQMLRAGDVVSIMPPVQGG